MGRISSVRVGDFIKGVEIMAVNHYNKRISMKCQNDHIFDVGITTFYNFKNQKGRINPPCKHCREQGYFQGTAHSKLYIEFEPIFKKYEVPNAMWRLYTKDWSVYMNRITNAKSVKHLNNTLTKEDFFKIVSAEKCFWCGKTEPTMEHLRNGEDVPRRLGIDRLDSSLGYTPDNCVPSCSLCNYMKNSFKVDIFLNKILDIAIYHLDDLSKRQINLLKTTLNQV